jgi:hypothetical protein
LISFLSPRVVGRITRTKAFYYIWCSIFFGSVFFPLSVWYSSNSIRYSSEAFMAHSLNKPALIFLVCVSFGLILSYNFKTINKKYVINFSRLKFVCIVFITINFLIQFLIFQKFNGLPIFLYVDGLNVSDANAMQSELPAGTLGVALLSSNTTVYLAFAGLLFDEDKRYGSYYKIIILNAILSLPFGKLGVLLLSVTAIFCDQLRRKNYGILFTCFLTIGFLANFILHYRSQGFVSLNFIDHTFFSYVLEYYSQSALNMLWMLHSDVVLPFSFYGLFLGGLPESIQYFINPDFKREIMAANSELLIVGAPSGFFAFLLHSGGGLIFSTIAFLYGLSLGYLVNRFRGTPYFGFFPFFIFSGLVYPVHALLLNHFFFLFPLVLFKTLESFIFPARKLGGAYVPKSTTSSG